MAYQLNVHIPISVYAQDRVLVASQFRTDVIAKYIQNYENFWMIGRDEFSVEFWQELLDYLGAVGIQVLQDALKYVSGLEISFPGELPEKYHSAPFEYHLEAPGRIVLDSVKEAWLPPAPPTTTLPPPTTTLPPTEETETDETDN